MKLRTCEIQKTGIYGYFHKWSERSEIIRPSLMKGGHGGGELRYTVAIVELEDGTIQEYLPKDIRMADHER